MWLDDWPQNISRSMWPIFHGSVILPYVFNTFWWSSAMHEEQCHANTSSMWPNDWYRNISWPVRDIYFMVQWFCLMSSVLFDGAVPCMRSNAMQIQVPCDPMIDTEIYLGQCVTYISWFSEFYLITGRLFDGEMSYLDYNFYLTRWLTSEYI